MAKRLDSDDISLGLRHSLIIHQLEKFRMHPISHKWIDTGGPLALGDLVRVMNRNMIDPSGMYIKRGAEVVNGHRAAFNVPSREAITPGRWPFHLTFFGTLGKFPKCEVRFVSF